jgi:hypothetical protein
LLLIFKSIDSGHSLPLHIFKMKTTITTLAALASVASAHFTMEFPTVRGFDEDKLTQWPCGAQDTVGIKGRTPFPMTGGEIALTMG